MLCCCGLSDLVYPKSPVSINGDNEVDHVDEEHQSVDVTHRTVLWMDDVIEELSYGKVYVKSSAERCQNRDDYMKTSCCKKHVTVHMNKNSHFYDGSFGLKHPLSDLLSDSLFSGERNRVSLPSLLLAVLFLWLFPSSNTKEKHALATFSHISLLL